MKTCIACEGILPDSQFGNSSPICKTCVARLNSEYHVEYSPENRQTIKESMVQLLLAIKEQAERDEITGTVSKSDLKYGGPVGAWRHHWVDSEPWKTLWDILRSAESRNSEIRSASSQYLKGIK